MKISFKEIAPLALPPPPPLPSLPAPIPVASVGMVSAGAVQMAAFSGGEPGTAHFTFVAARPCYVTRVMVECEDLKLAYIESVKAGVLDALPYIKGIQPVALFSAASSFTPELASICLEKGETFLVVVRNLSQINQWATACFVVAEKPEMKRR